MQYRRTEQFREEAKNLSKEAQQLIGEKFKLFAENQQHPSLRVKKMRGHDNIWEGHITMEIVFTFHRETDPETEEEIIIFRRIGTHEIYRNPQIGDVMPERLNDADGVSLTQG